MAKPLWLPPPPRAANAAGGRSESRLPPPMLRPWTKARREGAGTRRPPASDAIGNLFYGSKGYLAVDSYASYKSWLGREQAPGPQGEEGGDHYLNFIEAVRSRKRDSLNAGDRRRRDVHHPGSPREYLVSGGPYAALRFEDHERDGRCGSRTSCSPRCIAVRSLCPRKSQITPSAGQALNRQGLPREPPTIAAWGSFTGCHGNTPFLRNCRRL